MKNLVKINEKKDGYEILLLVAGSEEEYYSGETDTYDSKFISNNDIKTKDELIEKIGLYCDITPSTIQII